jgi:phosphoglycolate phosphatase
MKAKRSSEALNPRANPNIGKAVEERNDVKPNNQLSSQLFRQLEGKEHIIWDWNGTILNDVDHAVKVMNTLLEEHQLPLINRDYYREIFDFPVLNYYQKLGFNFERESFENLCHKFVERFMHGLPHLPLIPEMESVVSQLKDKKIMQSILSATDQANLEGMINHFKLNEYFKFVFGIANKLAGSKVYRGHMLIKESRVHESKTVMIGDTLHDLEVAKALGIDVVLISHGHQSFDRLSPHHTLVIEA